MVNIHVHLVVQVMLDALKNAEKSFVIKIADVIVVKNKI
jgi:hypothetical protein